MFVSGIEGIRWMVYVAWVLKSQGKFSYKQAAASGWL